MKVLVIAPHADDEILGVGGTMARHIAEGNEVYVCVVTRGYMPLCPEEVAAQIREESIACHKFMGVKETIYLDLPSTKLEHVDRIELNGKIQNAIHSIEPDEVYLPHYGDMQKDHQIVADSAMVALRPKYKHIVSRVYGYETLSETGWNVPGVVNEFIPDVYNDISKYLETKLKAMSFYLSQLGPFPDPRSLEALEALAKFRGSTCGCKAAESFRLIREIKVDK